MGTTQCRANKEVLAAKEKVVAETAEKIKKAKSIVLVDYCGINVSQDTELRSEMRKNNVEYRVIKNTILSRAFREAGIEGMDVLLEKPTAVAFSYDEVVTGPKIVSEMGDKTKKLEIKGGVVDGKFSDADAMKVLAKIPPKPVLLSMLLGLLTSPMRNLAVVLSEIAKKQSA